MIDGLTETDGCMSACVRVRVWCSRPCVRVRVGMCWCVCVHARVWQKLHIERNFLILMIYAWKGSYTSIDYIP